MELKLTHVTKQYGTKTAVDHINMTLREGIYGLLGANGAGKTSLMRLVCLIQKRSGGEITLDGREIQEMGEEYRSLLGYLPQNFGYYPEFTAQKFLLYMSALKGLNKHAAKRRIEELLDVTGLTDDRNRKIKTFSGGMLRRIGIAQTLLNNPEILVLDEPTAGLDPKERVRFRNIISSLGKDRIVLLSTHIVSDIEYIADRILIMKNGELIQEGTEAELTEKVKGHVWKCIVSEKEAECLGQRFVVSNMRSNGENIELRVISEKQPMREAELLDGTLEDAYLYETQSAEET